MALVRVTLGGKRLGYVRNNKAGSTTIINYLGQLLWNEKPTTYSGTNVQDFCGQDSYIGREKGLEVFIIVRNSILILIWIIFYGPMIIT